MARKSREEAEKTRARILASALALFARNGYERTTFNDIAARLKLTKGAVYWHFDSKEKLLVALVDEMVADFQRRLEAVTPREELSFPVVAKMMIENAKQIVEHPSSRSAFLFLKTQVRWGEATMKTVREEFLTNRRFGPFHAFVTAMENDARAGRLRDGVDAVEVASAAMAVWDGLVQSRIDGFLTKELTTVLTHTFEAIWNSIRKVN